MRALVVYESMYGNTHDVARHIAEGLRPTFDVSVVPVIRATPDVIAAADLVVVGGPTHAHAMSRTSTRRAAVDAASQAGSALEVDADAMGPGLREWFDDIADHHGVAAAFDTRVDMPAAVTGRASRGIARRLRRRGLRVVVEPESFFVDKKNHLLGGEEERAATWGRMLAATVVGHVPVAAK